MIREIHNNGDRVYDVAQEGKILSAREYGVRLGDVRAFIFNPGRLDELRVLYYAERKFKSFILFRAPKIWWRKL